MRTLRRYALVALLLSVVAAPSYADEADDLRKLRDTTISLINQLVEQGVLTRAKADAIIAQAEQAGTGAPAQPAGAAASGVAPGAAAGAAAAAPTGAPASAPPVAASSPPAEPGEVRVPYVPEVVKQEITQQVKQDVLAQAKTERWGEPGAFPDWLRHINFSGDVRFRFQTDRYPLDDTPNAPVPVLQFFGVNVGNSTTPENLLRFRARFGLTATPVQSVTVGIRFASGGVGSGANPDSENQTLGNYNSRATIGFDRAYIAYRPVSWAGITVGRLGNPFFYPTSLVWADDLSLEGIALGLHPQLTQSLSLFSTAGIFPIQQIDPTPTSLAPSKWLYGYQSGFDLHPTDLADLRLAAAYYDYQHVQGVPNPSIYSTQYSATAAPFRQTGNTVFDINGFLNTQNGTQNYLWGLASQFRELNLSASLDLRFVGPTHVTFDGDYVRNLGFNQQEILQRIGYLVQPQTTGWQTRLTVGYPTLHQQYAWQAFVGYRHVERDATLDAFTDSDFHLGGTDAQGYFVGGRFVFATDTAISLRWMSAKQIDGVELAGADSQYSGLPLAIDVTQLDITSTF